MKKKSLLRVMIIVVLVVLFCFYADTAYLRGNMLRVCVANAVGGDYKSRREKCDYLTFKEVLLNRGKYIKLLKEKYNISDYTP